MNDNKKIIIDNTEKFLEIMSEEIRREIDKDILDQIRLNKASPVHNYE